MIEIAQQTKHEMTYEDALLYCQFLEYNGHRDWRMPTQHEYRTTVTILGWYIDRIIAYRHWPVTPVRDI
jgi:hypothetical protein